jgi:hypothetical protein
MFVSRKKYKPWQSPKLFQNGDEWFEYNCPPLESKLGKRLIQFQQVGEYKKMIGAATIRKIKDL